MGEFKYPCNPREGENLDPVYLEVYSYDNKLLEKVKICSLSNDTCLQDLDYFGEWNYIEEPVTYDLRGGKLLVIDGNFEPIITIYDENGNVLKQIDTSEHIYDKDCEGHNFTGGYAYIRIYGDVIVRVEPREDETPIMLIDTNKYSIEDECKVTSEYTCGACLER